MNACLFDKTGTLTIGKLNGVECLMYKDENDGIRQANFVLLIITTYCLELDSIDTSRPEALSFLAMLGAAESASEHPIGKAVYSFCKEHSANLPQPENFTTFPGRGLSCTVDGTKVLVGNRAFIQGNNVPISATALASVRALESQGKTCVFVPLNGVLVGIVALSDILKPEAAAVVDILR